MCNATVDVALWTEKLNLLNSVSVGTMCGVKKLQVFNVQSFQLDTGILLLFYCPADNTLFEVSQEIRRLGVSSCYCCYANHAAGSKAILKLSALTTENWMRLSLSEIISKCCELVKLYHINRSDPVFLRHTVNKPTDRPMLKHSIFGRHRNDRHWFY